MMTGKYLQDHRSLPKINSTTTFGHALERLTGEIEFKNVVFSYPSRSV